MSAAPPAKTWTRVDYLAWERAQDTRHELRDGEVVAMPRAALAHTQIVANVGAELRAALRDSPCNVCMSNLRVKVPATGLYTYPDVSVVCGRAALEDEHLDTLLNPVVLVEVLSESTADYDRGTKFTHYRTIPSFRDYVLISSDRILIEHHARNPDGSWVLREHRAGERFRLESVGCELAVDEIYLKVFDRAS